MRKIYVIMLTMLVLCLSGCNKIEDAKESTVTANDQGVILQLLKEDLPSEKYQGEKLTEAVTTQIAEYNTSVGGQHITLKSSEFLNETMTMLLEYQTDEDYRDFNKVDFFAGSVQQAAEEGYAFAGGFQSAGKEKIEPGVIPDQCMDARVIIIREPFAVQVPGKILYTSVNMEIIDSSHARLPKDTDSPYENAGAVTQAYGYVIYRP